MTSLEGRDGGGERGEGGWLRGEGGGGGGDRAARSFFDDLRSSVEDQLHQHVNDVLGAAQQAASAVVQPVQAIGAGVAQAVQAPLIQPPSQEQVLGALQQHVDNITQPVQQAAQAVQQAPQQAMQVLGQPSQPGGALTQLGQTRDQVLGALNQHVDNITQAAQQVPQGLQDLSVPKPPVPEPPAATTALGGDQGLGCLASGRQPSTAPSWRAPPDDRWVCRTTLERWRSGQL